MLRRTSADDFDGMLANSGQNYIGDIVRSRSRDVRHGDNGRTVTP
jgi:hypothetical protein